MKVVALAAALVATTAAASTRDSCEYNCNSTCVQTEPKVRVVNRCPYKVYLWSIFKGDGCPSDKAAVIESGGFYNENYASPRDGVGVSLKISKTDKCKPDDTVQLEYYLEKGNYASNYLDVSYVDCLGGDCPTRKEGYYLRSGNQDGLYMANTLNEICPILSCSSPEECAKYSYLDPNDRQTKSCDLKADLNFYMCGGEAPGEEPSDPVSSAAPSSSSSSKDEDTPKSSSAPESSDEEAPDYTETEEPEVAAAAITPAPEEPKETKGPNIKTEVVYVTEYAYVHAKRHAHGHRHQNFRA